VFIDQEGFIGVDQETEIIKASDHSHHLAAVKQVNNNRDSLLSDLIEELILDIYAAFHGIRPRIDMTAAASPSGDADSRPFSLPYGFAEKTRMIFLSLKSNPVQGFFPFRRNEKGGFSEAPWISPVPI
jgi:hypothetical protein